MSRVSHAFTASTECVSSVVELALRLRTPPSLVPAVGSPLLGGCTMTHYLGRNEVLRRRRVYFKGTLSGQVVRCEDPNLGSNRTIEGDNPFAAHPNVHGHLELPLTYQGAVRGLLTIDDNNYDEGMGPCVCGIVGKMSCEPASLELSFMFMDYASMGDEDGFQADLELSCGDHDATWGFLRQALSKTPQKLRLNGTFGHTSTEEVGSGSAVLDLCPVSEDILESLHGSWCESWTRDPGRYVPSIYVDDDDELRLRKLIRYGPHPSLYPLLQLKALPIFGGMDVEIFGTWPFGEGRCYDLKEGKRCAASDIGEWILRRRIIRLNWPVVRLLFIGGAQVQGGTRLCCLPEHVTRHIASFLTFDKLNNNQTLIFYDINGL